MLRNSRMKFIKNPKKQFLLFIVLFFLLNFIQSYFTELLDDEAYYWVWSNNLAFGYFDHPPLIALWIKLSSFFFNGELGVRFFSIISFLITLVFIWLSIDTKEKWQYVWLYFLLICSVALLNIYGFAALPDSPLLLFVAVFLYAYKRFLETNSFAHTFLLGFAMAGMLYSKYHGVLVIVLIIISNIKLLKNKRFWIACLFGAFLFIPHILWQLNHGFPSIKYHLFDRSKKLYKFKYTLMHFVNLIAIIGVSFPIIYLAFFKQKITTTFEKGLRYIVLGFIVFFFLSSFKTSTQAQWNVVILVPLIILTFSYFIEHEKSRKWLTYLGLTNLILMLIARVFLVSSSLSPIELETHLGEKWAEEIRKKTNDRPIIFIGSYRNASKYNFYTDIKTHSYSLLRKHKSQYDLNNFEQNIQHEDVAIVGRNVIGYQLFENNRGIYYSTNIDDYVTVQKIQCNFTENKILLFKNKKQQISFEIYNPYMLEVSFDKIKFVGVFQGKKDAIIKEIPLEIVTNFSLKSKQRKTVNAFINIPKQMNAEILNFRITLKSYQLPSGFQGNKVNVLIKNE